MTKQVRIEVTAEDISLGRPGSTTSCPIAIAAKRALCGRDITVNAGFAHVGDVLSLLPIRAINFVSHFDSDDRRHRCKPFVFTLTLPEGGTNG